MKKKVKEVSRQYKWSRGKETLVLLNEEQKSKLKKAVDSGFASTEKYKSSKSRVIRFLIDKYL